MAMLADHAAAVLEVEWVRWSAGRLALPLFALLVGALSDGHMARRRRRQWLAAAWLFPVLHLVAFGSWWPGLLLAWLYLARFLVRELPGVAWLLAVVSVTAWANGLDRGVGLYVPSAVLVLVLVGWVVRADLERWGERLPAWCAALGRRSLSIYVGNVALIAAGRVVW